MKCRIELVFLIQCCVVSPKELSLDSSFGFRLALNQKSIVLSVLAILTGHQRVFLGFFQTLSLQCLTDFLCIYLTDSGNCFETTMNHQNLIEPIPVTILTGFLGSGKTTLLNRILTENHGLRIAVIENEFGAVGIDHELVVQADEEIFEMNNGCICCNVRGDLIRILTNLAKRKDRFDRIIVETTGLADPAPVVQTFLMDDDMKTRFFVDGVVTLVDAKHAPLHLQKNEEMQEQIAFADRIILNKCDLAEKDSLGELKCQIRAINPIAEIQEAVQALVPIGKLLSIGGFDLGRATENDPSFLEGAHHHHHSAGISSVALEAPGDCDGQRLQDWLSKLTQERGADVFRIKGYFAVEGIKNRVVFQAVHMIIDATQGAPWGSAPRKNAVVFIGKKLNGDTLKADFHSCLLHPPTR